MLIRLLRWIDSWFSRLGGEAQLLEQRKNPDYRQLIADAEDVQKNKGYKNTLTKTLAHAGIPTASQVLANMVTLYIAQLQTSTFLKWQFESTMPIPIKNPEKIMFLRFTLFEGERPKDSNVIVNYLIRDVKIALMKAGKYESSRLIDGVFDGRSVDIKEVEGQMFSLSIEEILPIKVALVDLHKRNLNWAQLQKDAARQKVAVDLLENYLGIQHTALPAPDEKSDKAAIQGKVGDKKPNPFDELQSELSGQAPKPLPSATDGKSTKKTKSQLRDEKVLKDMEDPYITGTSTRKSEWDRIKTEGESPWRDHDETQFRNEEDRYEKLVRASSKRPARSHGSHP